MTITSFRLVNYRCFEETGTVYLAKFATFIGKNDGGKSSALRAISRVLQNEPFTTEDHRKTVGEGVDFPIDTAPILQVYVTLDPGTLDSFTIRYSRELPADDTQLPLDRWEILGEIVDDDRLNGDFAVRPLQELKDLVHALGLTAKGTQSAKATFITALEEHRQSLPRHPGWRALPLEIAKQFPEVYYYDDATDPDPQQAIKNFLTQYYKTALAHDVPEAIAEHRAAVENRFNEKVAELVPVLREHCPEIESVSVALSEKSFMTPMIQTVRITQGDHRPIVWESIGSGKKREMSLAIFRWQQKILGAMLDEKAADGSFSGALVLFDEPDVNLDYEAQRRAYRTLLQLGEHQNCQVIVATHSPSLIDNSPIADILFFEGPRLERSEHGIWYFDTGTDDAEVMDTFREALGVRNSALFNERIVVLCEGPTEFRTFGIAYRAVTNVPLQLAGVYLIDGQNKEQAKSLAKILAKNKMTYHLVLDSDCKASTAYLPANLRQRDGIAESDVSYLGQSEFEDMFSNAQWVLTLNQRYTDQTEPWTEEEVETWRFEPKFSGSLLASIEKRSLGAASKPDLGLAVTRMSIENDQLPAELKELMNIIRGKADRGEEQ